jgi:hypothetical protein
MNSLVRFANKNIFLCFEKNALFICFPSFQANSPATNSDGVTDDVTESSPAGLSPIGDLQAETSSTAKTEKHEVLVANPMTAAFTTTTL